MKLNKTFLCLIVALALTIAGCGHDTGETVVETPTHTVQPAETPKPTMAPEVIATEKPTKEPETKPTQTPKPEATENPTPTPTVPAERYFVTSSIPDIFSCCRIYSKGCQGQKCIGH